VPIRVVNEANLVALGEHDDGVAAGYQDFVHLSASAVGLGAGIMLSGELFQGVDGYAGECGCMVLDPSGPLCAFRRLSYFQCSCA
jgi:glucokinase